MAVSKYIYRGDEFTIRSPAWWRDFILGSTFGIALLFFLSDSLHWETFRKHIPSELIFIFVPFVLALLSPRRLLAFFLGLTILVFRGILLIFLFENRWSALITIVCAIALIFLAREVNRRYRQSVNEIPDDTTALEMMVVLLTFCAAFGLLFMLRRVLGLT